MRNFIGMNGRTGHEEIEAKRRFRDSERGRKEEKEMMIKKKANSWLNRNSLLIV